MAKDGVKDFFLPGSDRREARRARRKRRDKANKQKNTYLGGSEAEEKALYADARQESKDSSERQVKAADEISAELKNSRQEQKRAGADYRVDRTQAKTDLGNQRRGVDSIYEKTGQGNWELDQGLDSAMATRNSALASGSLVDSTEDAILSNQANAQAQQRYAAGLVNRGAMGLAAGQGESGALALQSAMAGAAQGNADATAQSNLQLADQNAQLRLAAAEQERQNQLAIAEANASAQLGVAGQKSTNTVNSALTTQQALQGVTQAAQGQQGLSSQRDLTLQGQNANLATGGAQVANAAEATDKGYQSDILTAKYNAGQARNAEAGRSTIKKVLMPFGILGN